MADPRAEAVVPVELWLNAAENRDDIESHEDVLTLWSRLGYPAQTDPYELAPGTDISNLKAFAGSTPVVEQRRKTVADARDEIAWDVVQPDSPDFGRSGDDVFRERYGINPAIIANQQTAASELDKFAEDDGWGGLKTGLQRLRMANWETLSQAMAEKAEQDRLGGYGIGADDYILEQMGDTLGAMSGMVTGAVHETGQQFADLIMPPGLGVPGVATIEDRGPGEIAQQRKEAFIAAAGDMGQPMREAVQLATAGEELPPELIERMQAISVPHRSRLEKAQAEMEAFLSEHADDPFMETVADDLSEQIAGVAMLVSAGLGTDKDLTGQDFLTSFYNAWSQQHELGRNMTAGMVGGLAAIAEDPVRALRARPLTTLQTLVIPAQRVIQAVDSGMNVSPAMEAAARSVLRKSGQLQTKLVGKATQALGETRVAALQEAAGAGSKLGAKAARTLLDPVGAAAEVAGPAIQGAGNWLRRNLADPTYSSEAAGAALLHDLFREAPKTEYGLLGFGRRMAEQADTIEARRPTQPGAIEATQAHPRVKALQDAAEARAAESKRIAEEPTFVGPTARGAVGIQLQQVTDGLRGVDLPDNLRGVVDNIGNKAAKIADAENYVRQLEMQGHGDLIKEFDPELQALEAEGLLLLDEFERIVDPHKPRRVLEDDAPAPEVTPTPSESFVHPAMRGVPEVTPTPSGVVHPGLQEPNAFMLGLIEGLDEKSAASAAKAADLIDRIAAKAEATGVRLEPTSGVVNPWVPTQMVKPWTDPRQTKVDVYNPTDKPSAPLDLESTQAAIGPRQQKALADTLGEAVEGVAPKTPPGRARIDHEAIGLDLPERAPGEHFIEIADERATVPAFEGETPAFSLALNGQASADPFTVGKLIPGAEQRIRRGDPITIVAKDLLTANLKRAPETGRVAAAAVLNSPAAIETLKEAMDFAAKNGVDPQIVKRGVIASVNASMPEILRSQMQKHAAVDGLMKIAKEQAKENAKAGTTFTEPLGGTLDKVKLRKNLEALVDLAARKGVNLSINLGGRRVNLLDEVVKGGFESMPPAHKKTIRQEAVAESFRIAAEEGTRKAVADRWDRAVTESAEKWGFGAGTVAEKVIANAVTPDGLGDLPVPMLASPQSVSNIIAKTRDTPAIVRKIAVDKGMSASQVRRQLDRAAKRLRGKKWATIEGDDLISDYLGLDSQPKALDMFAAAHKKAADARRALQSGELQTPEAVAAAKKSARWEDLLAKAVHKLLETDDKSVRARYYVPKDVASNLHWHTRMMDATRGEKARTAGLKGARFAKSNVTARNVASFKNNFIGNAMLQGILRAEPMGPVKLWRAGDLARRVEKGEYANAAIEADIARSQLDAFNAELNKPLNAYERRAMESRQRQAQKAWDEAERRLRQKRLIEAGEREGVSSLDMLSHDMARLESSGMVGGVRNPLAMGSKAMEKLYTKQGDNLWKWEDFLHQADEFENVLSILEPGVPLSVGRRGGKRKKIQKDADGAIYLLTSAGKKLLGRLDARGRVIRHGGQSKALDQVIAEASNVAPQGKFVDYSDQPNFVKAQRSHAAGGLLSPFYTWFNHTLWIPGIKKGLPGLLFDTGGLDLKTKSPAIRDHLAGKAISSAARRSFIVNGLRNDMLQAGTDPNLEQLWKRMFRFNPADKSAMIVKEASNPGWVDTFDMSNSDPFISTLTALRLLSRGEAVVKSDEVAMFDILLGNDGYSKIYGKDGDLTYGLPKSLSAEERRRTIKLRQHLKKAMTGELGGVEDFLDLAGAAGSFGVQMFVDIAKAQQFGGEYGLQDFVKRMGPVLMGGTYFNAFQAGLREVDPASPLLVTRWAKTPLTEGGKEGLHLYVRNILGLGWKALPVSDYVKSTGKRGIGKFNQDFSRIKARMRDEMVKPLDNAIKAAEVRWQQARDINEETGQLTPEYLAAREDRDALIRRRQELSDIIDLEVEEAKGRMRKLLPFATRN